MQEELAKKLIELGKEQGFPWELSRHTHNNGWSTWAIKNALAVDVLKVALMNPSKLVQKNGKTPICRENEFFFETTVLDEEGFKREQVVY